MSAPTSPSLEVPASGAMPSLVGVVAAGWGVFGVVTLLAQAVSRLSPRAWIAMQGRLGPTEWLVLIGSVAFLAYTEGYKGFHLGFSPRVVARARYLAQRPVWWHALLAPLFCMGFFHATKKRRIVAWVLTIGIVGLIVVVRLMPIPWRGFVDAGVVVALSMGVLSMLYYAVRALRGLPDPLPADVPEDA